MSITIQSPEGRPLTTVSLNRGAKAAFSLMEHEYIELPFKLTEPVNIPVGSYVETAGHFDEATAALLRPRYYVCKPQSPTWNERTGAFEYRLRLDAPHYLWNNFIFRYTPENTGAEASWTLTAPLDVQLGVFLRNLAALGFTHAGKPYTYVIHDTVENKAVAMTYDGTHLLDALYGMGDKEHWGCDVWVVDNAIHFGRCESGDPVRIELDAEARTMARSESKTDYATRLLVFGGTKNLPENYRAASPALTVNGVVQRRLMLPSGTPYVDVHPGRSVFGTVEQIVTFDDIYPRRTGTLSGVRTVDRTVKEGDKQTGTFKAYQYRDAGLTFKDNYVLKGQELRVVFQSGKLNGLHFAVQFNPEGKSPADQLWEIVANSDYGRLLPDETVRPADGDKYVLYGFDIRLVSDQYVPSAEQELKRRAEEYARRLAADDGTYTATLRGSWVDADPLRRTFAAGQRVRLVNPAFFPSDGRESRVIGWELNLDIPTDAPVYTFGESARYSRLADIEEKVDALVYKGTTYTGGGGSGVYVVRANDSTPPSDSNVLSALRALATFLRKDRPDTMPHLLKLLDGVETGTFAAGRTGGRIDKQGNGELGSLTLRDLLTAVRLIADGVRSKNYTPGDMGTGFGLTTGEGGSLLEVDYLLVRRVATFVELLIREMRHVGGTLVLSGASGKVVRVEDKPAAWRVYFKIREDGTTVAHGFTVGAQARCQTYNRTSGNTYYWRLVTAVGDDWVELSKSDYDKAAPTGTARTAPAVGDELVQLGHRTDARQTGAIVLDTVGEGAPSIRLLKDIRSYSLTDANVRVLLSPSTVRVIADEVSFSSGKTVEQTIEDSSNEAVTAAKEYVDGLQIGGRNLAQGTSDDWVTILNGPTKTTITYFKKAQTSSLTEGEYLSVSIEASWSGLTFGGTGRAVLQAVGDVSGWTKEAIFDDRMSSTVKKASDGFYRYTASYRWTKERAKNDNFTFSIRLDEATGVFKIRRLMVVRGQKPMDWQPAPEDWVTKINDAKSAGTAAADALEAYKKTVSETFHDGVIQEAEALAIEKYRNIVNSEFGALTNTYNAINGNAYLEGTAKSALANAFNALRAAKDALITSVNNAISDKRVTEGEKQAVDAKYNAYQSAYAAYSAALETANGSIHAKLKGLADKAANDIQVGGRNLIPDSDNGQLKHFIIHQPNNAPRYSTVDGWWRMAFDRDKQIVSRELTMSSVGTVQGLRKGNLAFSILCRTDGRIVSENLRISFFGGGVHRYVPANIENCGNNTYRIWGVYMNYPVSDLRVPDFMSFSTADATYVEFRYPKLEYGTKPTDWTPAPEDITSEIAAKTEAARQAAQAEAIGLNKWIAQAYYTGENKAATPPKLEDIAGKTPTRTMELTDAQFNLSGNGSVFNMDNYTGIRTTYVYLEADYNLTTGIQHDDAGALYVNGALVASGGLINTSWKSATLPLKKGWNRIDGLWNEGGGGDFFKFKAPLENDAHIIQLACRPNVSIDPMRAVTMERVEEQKAGFNTFNEQFSAWSKRTEQSIQKVDDKVKGFTTVDKNGQVLIKPESVWAGVETKVQQLSDESLKKLSVGGRNLIRNSDTSAAPVAMKGPTDGTAYKVFPVKTTLVKHDCQEKEPYTLTVWYTSTSQFPFESFPIGGKPGGDDWSVRFIASEGTITQEGGMKKCVMQAVVPKGGRVLYNPTVGFIYGANDPCNMSLYRVKLERGTKGTDWTPAPEDLPTIDTLTRTGIDIQQGVITLDAQKVKVQNGSQTMAMFEGGKLKAELIDASRIDAGKLNASQIFSGTIDARNATFNNLTVSQGSKLGGWKVQGSDLVSDAATNASIRIEHRGKFLTSDESNPIEINNSTGNTLLIDGSRSSVQAEVTLTGKINNIRALSELSPAGLYTNLAAQEYKYGSLGAVVANVMYMPSGRSFRTAGVVGRIHDSAPNRNASYKKGFNGVFGENLRADGLMLGARDLTGDGTVYSIESLMTDTVLLIRGRPIIDLSNTPAELKGKFFFIFTHTGTRVRFKKDGRITQDNNAWNIFLLFNGSTWEVRSWDCDYREF